MKTRSLFVVLNSLLPRGAWDGAQLGRLGSQHVSVPVEQHPSSLPHVLIQKLHLSALHLFSHFQGLYTNSHTTV